MRTRGGRKYDKQKKRANKSARKRKRKKLSTTLDKDPETQDFLGKEVAVDKDPETQNNTGKKGKRKNLSTTLDKDPETQDNLGKEVAVDKDPEEEPTPDTQDKDPEKDIGLPTATQPKDKPSGATQENEITDSGREQDKTGETDKPSAPSSTVEDNQELELRAKAKECYRKANELHEKREDAECFDRHSVCS